jgi:hypothetical protein
LRRHELFGGVVFLPRRIEKRAVAIKALRHLFTKARSYREGAEDSSKSDTIACQISNIRGQRIRVSYTKNVHKPISLRFESVMFVDKFKKMKQISQVIHVDAFPSSSEYAANRWVNWFEQQFDEESLERLLLCA